MKRWRDLAALTAVERQGHAVEWIEGREIGVVRDAASGDIFAFRNRCPHTGAPICLGSIAVRDDVALPGAYGPRERRVLRCPWHGWEFDLGSGRCLDDPAMRVATYAVRVRDGRVEVEA